MIKRIYILFFCLLSIIIGCRKSIELQPEQYLLYTSIALPDNFPSIVHPEDNPLTEEGIFLGRHLFWEKRLSGDNTMSCASCHLPQYAFAEPTATSTGINGISGNRNAMVLQNLAWANEFFWDGRALSLEEQIIMPVMDPIEMNESWSHFFEEIKYDNDYRRMFYDAFLTFDPDSTHAAKAIAQFLRTMVSCNSKYDKVMRNEAIFTPEENAGFDSFNSLIGGDCFHCHGGILTTDHSFRNNGLDEFPTDTGKGAITGLINDQFKFKVPSLRNIEYSAPYMHDGRFQDLDDVINFYSILVQHNSPNIDPLMEFSQSGGVQLDPQERAELKAFLLTFSDPEFINNPDFSDPN